MNGMIDVHHHVPAAEIAEAAARVGITVGGGWTPERALADMDASGIAAAVLTPIIFVADVADPGGGPSPSIAPRTTISRAWRGAGPTASGRSPRCPSWTPTPPAPSSPGRSTSWAWTACSCPGGVGPDLIGAERFDAVLAALDRRGATIHLHPTASPVGVPGLPALRRRFPRGDDARHRQSAGVGGVRAVREPALDHGARGRLLPLHRGARGALPTARSRCARTRPRAWPPTWGASTTTWPCAAMPRRSPACSR